MTPCSDVTGHQSFGRDRSAYIHPPTYKTMTWIPFLNQNYFHVQKIRSKWNHK